MKICQRMYEAAADDLTKAVEEEQEQEGRRQQGGEEEKEAEEEQGGGRENRSSVAQDRQPEVRACMRSRVCWTKFSIDRANLVHLPIPTWYYR